MNQKTLTQRLLSFRSTPLSLVVALSFATLILHLYIDSNLHWLGFSPVQIRAGYLWQLLTCHWLHWSWWHLLPNLFAFWIISFLFFNTLSALHYAYCIVAISLAIGAGLYFFSPDNIIYIGSSGVLHGLFVLGIFFNRGWPIWKRIFLLGLIAVKLIQENLMPNSLSVLHAHYQFVVATDAHLYGAISGLILGLLRETKRFVGAEKISPKPR